MNLFFIRSAKILQQGSPFHQKIADVTISNGVITGIGQKLPVPRGATVIEAEGHVLSAGFFDLNANFGEPGLETKEDLESGTKAAAAGGFTGVAVMPNTVPPLYSKAGIAYLVNKGAAFLTGVYPLGTISYKQEGKDLAELYDMHLAGAVAFTDGHRPVEDSGLMSRAMQYVKSFGGLVFSYAEDVSLAGTGKMNEGVTSTYLGMKGIPSLAEELMVARDIYLAEYNDSAIHFCTISTAHSVGLVRQAKKRGSKVSCDVAAHHLLLTEDALAGFDSNFKVKPPLRTKKDVKALLTGLADGTIDAIVSQHTPHEPEFKNVEFETASYGIIGLQTVLPVALMAGLSPELIVNKLAEGPRKLLGLPVPLIKEGEEADLVLFNPSAKWIFNTATNYSRSANSPFFGKELTGRVAMVFNRKKTISFAE